MAIAGIESCMDRLLNQRSLELQEDLHVPLSVPEPIIQGELQNSIIAFSKTHTNNTFLISSLDEKPEQNPAPNNPEKNKITTLSRNDEAVGRIEGTLSRALGPPFEKLEGRFLHKLIVKNVSDPDKFYVRQRASYTGILYYGP